MEIKARMPGKVISISVNVGDTVTKGLRVMLLEAMKMETPLGSPCDGTVTEIRVAAGAKVNSGQVLMVIG